MFWSDCASVVLYNKQFKVERHSDIFSLSSSRELLICLGQVSTLKLDVGRSCISGINGFFFLFSLALLDLLSKWLSQMPGSGWKSLTLA
jgi:hypothetical protein